jgi:hypothetical protein
MHLLARFKYFWLLLLISSCKLYEVKNSSKSPDALVQYWLSTSLYGGDFYDDSYYLIDFKPFFTINFSNTPKEKFLIPAGTLVSIARISRPGQERPLGPEKNIWVHLKVAKERGQVSFFKEKEHILILPENITTKAQVKSYLAQILSKKDPNLWVINLASHIQKAIFNKKPIIGMNKQELLACLGQPLKKQKENNEEWHYYNFFIILTDNLVSKIKNIK